VRSKLGRLGVALYDYFKHVTACDVLVIGGGTLFIDKGRPSVSLALLYLTALYARVIGRRVVIIGVAMDILTHPISLWLTRRILRLASFVAVRDSLSLPYVAHLDPARVRCTADLAFLLDPVPAARARSARPVVGLCLIAYYRPVEPSDRNHAAYCSAILRLIKRNSHRFDFVAVMFQCEIGQRDDWILPLLAEHFPMIDTLHVVDNNTAQRLASKVDVFVTTRFHLGILGVLWEKPVIVLDHELKLTALASEFGFPTLPLSTFLAGDIDLAPMLAGFDPARTAAACKTARERAVDNFAWLEQALD